MTSGWAFLGISRVDMASHDGAVYGGVGLALSAQGSIRLVDENAHVRQSILILLATRPGERVMRPDYGCPLHRLVFNPNDATTAGLAIHYVRQALLHFEPRIDILTLDAGLQEGIMQAGSAGAEDLADSTLFIHLDYRVRSTLRAERLTFTLDLMGDRA
jgi:phage baseplate assembly protein W